MSDKYPRTVHLPRSPGKTKDDRVIKDISTLLNVPVILTEKMDGSNICMTRYGVFARSHNGPPTHSSFDWLKSQYAALKYNIPEGLSVFGEYLYAKHSIKYNWLPNYIMLFGVRDDRTQTWWSWDEVESLTEELGLPTVPVWEKTQYSTIQQLENSCSGMKDMAVEVEGFVVRWEGSFHNNDFDKAVAKWVRANHVQTDEHWMNQIIEPNELSRSYGEGV